MTWTLIIAGFSLGVISSLHCVGMCGPIAMALPVQHQDRQTRFLSITLYHTGRILTYALLGLLVGMAGRNIFLAGFQRWLSIIVGIVVLAYMIQTYIIRRNRSVFLDGIFFSRLRNFMWKMLKQQKGYNFLLLGMANGLLPCGMVYIALAGAVTAGNIPDSIFFMTAFGAATLPSMVAVGYFGQFLKLSIRNVFRQSVPYLLTGMAILLILRGLNLDIPYISPVLQMAAGLSPVSCH